jgi:hypothetical protein
MDLAGNNFNGGEWSFRTNDTSAPAVISRNPDNGAIDIAQNTGITVIFSESLVTSTVHNNSVNFKLQKDFGDTPSSVLRLSIMTIPALQRLFPEQHLKVTVITK